MLCACSLCAVPGAGGAEEMAKYLRLTAALLAILFLLASCDLLESLLGGDLEIQEITVDADGITVVVSNGTAESFAIVEVAILLSADLGVNLVDADVGRVVIPDFEAGSDASGTIDIADLDLTGIDDGEYIVGGFVDPEDEIQETDELNNSFVVLVTVTVTGGSLVIDGTVVPTPTGLTVGSPTSSSL